MVGSKKILPIGLVALICIVVALSGCTSDSSSNSASDKYSANGTSGASSGQSSASALKILSSSDRRDSIGNYIIDGQVQNTGSVELTYVKIYATGYDSSGNVVTTGFTYAKPEDIPAGGKSGFKVYLDDEKNEIVKYDLQAST